MKTTPDSKSIETKLDGHDVAFSAESNSRDSKCIFRGIIIASDEAASFQTKERLERLRLLDGGLNAFAVVVLDGDLLMQSLLVLQKECVEFDQTQISIPSPG